MGVWSVAECHLDSLAPYSISIELTVPDEGPAYVFYCVADDQQLVEGGAREAQTVRRPINESLIYSYSGAT